MKKITKFTLIFLVLVCFFVWSSIARSPHDNFVHLYVLDVGQGDSILIEKGDYQILIDGGPDDKVLTELGKVMPTYDRNIEKVVLTHPHADHLTGLNQVLDRYEIGIIYTSGVAYDSNTYANFLNKVKEKNISYEVPKTFEKVMIFDDGSLEFLWPGDQFQNKTVEDLNNTSIVSKFCYFSVCALLTGDIQTDKQAEMLALTKNNNVSLNSDLLKIAHHGSINGTNQALLDAVKPKFAVISVGADNKFGHPHAAVIDLLNTNKIPFFRTDRDGTVEFAFSASGMVKK